MILKCLAINFLNLLRMVVICLLSDFDSACLSLCNVSEMKNFTGHSNPETQIGSVEIVNGPIEGVQSASHDPTSVILTEPGAASFKNV